METKLKTTKEKGLIIQFITNINKKIEKRKIKDKKYTSTQYNITIPTVIAELTNNNIFIEPISQTKYNIYMEDKGNKTIPLNLRKSKTKKYIKYLLTLPKKTFGFLDYYYDEESQAIISCYEKDNKICMELEIT